VVPSLSLMLIQTDPALATSLERIAWAQLIMAAAMGVIVLLALGAALVSYGTMRSLSKMIWALEQMTVRLTPRAEPIFESTAHIAQDLAAITGTIRGETSKIQESMELFNQQILAASRATDERVRQFGEVLRVCQDEVEDVLLDAAATARGLHTTAEVLTRPAPPRPGTVRGAAAEIRLRQRPEQEP
jgi:hypothetical protein